MTVGTRPLMIVMAVPHVDKDDEDGLCWKDIKRDKIRKSDIRRTIDLYRKNNLKYYVKICHHIHRSGMIM